ncbi:uncharacterized protein K441DRAFT_698929 [Cenococcum geophilum 1.58]|uniref:uncharacterized protein n=1 Tax=Cenococcum geophilum 1.58 TaxID=794803 RepID=UPI00358F0960|nr:hypothetical protein K441DRAFT_698929 [Cenococcum geophilum 1.58]
MLDPITAVGIASNVAQFVDFGFKIFSKSGELYKSASGLTVDDEELSSIATNFENLAMFAKGLPSLHNSKGCSDSEQALFSIANSCTALAGELKGVLDKIRVQYADGGSQEKWAVLHAVLRRMRKSGKIDLMAKNLDILSRQLTSCLVTILSDKQSATLTSLRDLCESTELWQTRSIDELDYLRDTNLEVLKHLKSLRKATQSLMGRVVEHHSFLTWQKDSQRLKGLEDISSKLLNWINTSERLATEQHFLDSLYYKAMKVRHSKIMDAHAKTFEWVFVDSSSPVLDGPQIDTSFMEWLTNRNGIYWICGKAGSGKSTIMKFLCDRPKTRAALEEWAAGDTLVTASFFFWNAGTELQKSQEGLLRSLLYEVLKKIPCLIPAVFPSQWHSHTKDRTAFTSWNWSRSELIKGCSRLVKQDNLVVKFCFFVDGLDEYSGDCDEVAQLLCDLAQSSSSFKICVSSRPWNVFQRTFTLNKIPRLLLEHLTRNDIGLYVETKLGENDLYRNFLMKEKRCSNFVTEIVDKANGVFLWVFLVVRSLLEGLKNEDRLSDLERRLRFLPTDLEEYFHHMLSNIEDVYQEQAAQSFQVAMHAGEPLTLLTYSFIDEDAPGYAADRDIRELTANELWSRYEVMKKRLNARCKDLLEVTQIVKVSHTSFSKELLPLLGHDPVKSTNLTANDFFVYRVDFLHRTVRDFLRTKEMQDLLESRLSEEFDPVSCLCQAFLAQIKSIPMSQNMLGRDGPLLDLVEDITYYARESEIRAHNPKAQTQVLGELERVLNFQEEKYSTKPMVLRQPAAPLSPAHKELRNHRFTSLDYSFLGFAVRKELRLFVGERLHEQSTLGNTERMTKLLRCALHPSTVSPKYDTYVDSNMVQLLLDNGAGAGQIYDGKPIWLSFLFSIESNWESTGLARKECQIEVLRVLLKNDKDLVKGLELEMVWVDLLLIPSQNWQLNSDRLENLLSELIQEFLSRLQEVDPNKVYKGSTLLGHFVAPMSASSRRITKLRQFKLIEAFIQNGSDPYFSYSEPLSMYRPHEVKFVDRNTVLDKLMGIYSIDELSRIGISLENLSSSTGVPGPVITSVQEPVSSKKYWLAWLGWD